MEEMNNNEVQNIEPTNNGGVKVLLVILIIMGLIIIGLLSYKMFVQDKKNDKKEIEKVEEKTYDKEKINKELKNIALNLRASSGKNNLGIDKNGDYFKNFDMKYNYVKYDAYQNDKLQVTIGMDENGNLMGETYSKCNKGIGSASIKVNEFINYYEKIFGEKVDETLLKNNKINIVDGYICTTIPSFVGNSSVLKIIEKSKDGDVYTLDIVVLSNVVNDVETIDDKYLDESLLTWPEEVEKAKLVLKYKLNDDGSYKILSLKVNDLKENTKLSKELEEEIEANITKIPYTNIITANISNVELFRKVALKEAMSKVNGTDISDFDMAGDDTTIIKNIAKALGLTNDEINKIDIDLWKEIYGGSTGYTMYNKEDLVKKIEELYKNYKYNLDLDDSKYIALNTGGAIYDKNIEKVIYHMGGAAFEPITPFVMILSDNLEDNMYRVKFIEALYKYATMDGDEKDYCYVIYKDNSKKKIECFSKTANVDTKTLEPKAKDYTMSHKDELPQYEISFKINNDNTYEFVDIKKIN